MPEDKEKNIFDEHYHKENEQFVALANGENVWWQCTDRSPLIFLNCCTAV